MVSQKTRTFLFSTFLAHVLIFALAAALFAHPLGNFTINHYARLELEPNLVRLYIVYDFAEIPAFQEKQTIDANGDGNIMADEREQYLTTFLGQAKANLTLDIGGKPTTLALVPNSTQLEFLAGQGGLEIMQFRARFTAPLELKTAPLTIRYRDDNYRERLGWREIVAKPVAGVTLTQSNVRETETSDELRNYPEDLLANPLNDREAIMTVTRGGNGTAGSGKRAESDTNSFVILALLAGVVVAVASVFLILRRKPTNPSSSR